MTFWSPLLPPPKRWCFHLRQLVHVFVYKQDYTKTEDFHENLVEHINFLNQGEDPGFCELDFMYECVKCGAALLNLRGLLVEYGLYSAPFK